MKQLALLLAFAACKRGGTEARSYVLDLGRAGIRVTMSVPTAWDQELDNRGCPMFHTGGDIGLGMGVCTLACDAAATSADACIDAVMKANFGSAQTKIEPGAAGSRWVTADRVAPMPKLLHMRRFIPVLARHEVVMCFGMLSNDGRDQATALRAACDSLAVGG